MAKELIYKVRIDYDASSAVSGADRIEDSQKEARFSIKQTEEAFDDLFAAQKRNSNATRSFSKNTSRANQVLFNFGDLANDAQQFSFGFSNGLRAIGNNVSFAAEGLANLNSKSSGFKGTLKALGSSLLGPGGIILGINLAVTAFTVFGDKLTETEEKVEDFGIETKKTTELLNDFISSDVNDFVDSFESLERQSQAIDDAIANLVGRLPEGVDLSQQLAQIYQDQQNYTQRTARAQEDAIFSLKEQREPLTEIEQRALKILQNKQAELEAQLKIQEALKGTLQSEKEIQQFTTDVDTTADFDVAGIETEEGRFNFLARRVETLPEVFQNASEKIKAIKRDEVQTRIGLEQKALSTISSLAQAIAPRNKALALSLIAIEKGLKIAQVIADGTQKAAAATAQGLLFLANPATAPLAGQAFSAAASIKANTAAAAGIIAAQGLAEGISATQGGRSRGIGGGAPANGVGGGFQETQRTQQPIRGVSQPRDSEPTIVVEANNVLPDTEFSVRADRGKKRRLRGITSVSEKSTVI